MDRTEKISKVKAILGIDGNSEDTLIGTYVDLAESEILAWMYNGKTPTTVTTVPTKYETTQIMSVVSGYTIRGAEGQKMHYENGVQRTFVYDDMIAYIHSHVIPMVEVF